MINLGLDVGVLLRPEDPYFSAYETYGSNYHESCSNLGNVWIC